MIYMVFGDTNKKKKKARSHPFKLPEFLKLLKGGQGEQMGKVKQDPFPSFKKTCITVGKRAYFKRTKPCKESSAKSFGETRRRRCGSQGKKVGNPPQKKHKWGNWVGFPSISQIEGIGKGGDLLCPSPCTQTHTSSLT